MRPLSRTSVILRSLPRPSSHTRLQRYMSSLKTIAVLDENQLHDGQMLEVDFDQGKVLLSKFGGKIYATGAYCTHYGAPLAKGVLSSDGRVTCPWHGACFNLCSGDIEDAPAPASLHSFQVRTSDGKIHVTANPILTLKENNRRPPVPLSVAFETMGNGVVIIGGGAGAFHAVEALREYRYKGPITIVTKEPHTPIDRTKLSKALITDASLVELKTAADLKIKFGTNVRLGVEATGVNVEKKEVILDGGKERLVYDNLIIATGGVPRSLPIEGAQLENVYTLRTLEDSRKIDAAAKEGKRMVVIGSSFISMEVVTTVSKRKLASIDVIGKAEVPFEAVLGKEVGAGLQKYHESQGVRFHMSSKVERIVPLEDNPSLAGGVVVNGVTLPADLVVMGVGVRPATDFLKESDIPLQRDGSIKVNEYLRVMGLKELSNVYAIGDVALYPQATSNENIRIEHWSVAGNHGRAAGKSIAGNPRPFVKVPVFWSAQGQQLRYCGSGHGYDNVIVQGNPAEMKFIAYYIRNNKVIAVASMQNDPVVSKASVLLRSNMMPTPDAIRNGTDLLSVDIRNLKAM